MSIEVNIYTQKVYCDSFYSNLFFILLIYYFIITLLIFIYQIYKFIFYCYKDKTFNSSLYKILDKLYNNLDHILGIILYYIYIISFIGIFALCSKIPSMIFYLLLILIFLKLLLGVVHIILQYLEIIVNNKYNYSYLLNIGDILPFAYLLSFLNTESFHRGRYQNPNP